MEFGPISVVSSSKFRKLIGLVLMAQRTRQTIINVVTVWWDDNIGGLSKSTESGFALQLNDILDTKITQKWPKNGLCEKIMLTNYAWKQSQTL